MYGLLTKCEVKIAGYLANSFFACLWTETESRSINLQKQKQTKTKKTRAQHPAILTKQAWAMKDFSYGFWGNFSGGTQQVVLSRKDSFINILPTQVANRSPGFDSSYPITELAI